jgi:hypothetical protein
MKIKQKYRNFQIIYICLAGILVMSAFSACSQGPSEDDVYTAFISLAAAVPTTKEVTFNEDSTTDGVIIYNYDNVAESTYGYTFNGLVRDTFTAESHSYWGMLDLTGGAVTTLVLNYTNTGGVFTGTITGDTTAIDLAGLEITEQVGEPAEEPAAEEEAPAE